MKDAAQLNSVKPVYDPFGMLLSGRSWEAGSRYRYGFNGQELVYELFENVTAFDFGNRLYNSSLGKFFSIDFYSAKFPGQSPYIIAGNTPIMGADVNGDSLYIMIYVNGYNSGDNMFKAAAFTRGLEIKSSAGYNEARDEIVYLEVQDVSSIGELVSQQVRLYTGAGNTVEIGIWSHSGYDGPTGSNTTTVDPLDGNQMTIAGWSKINFNFYNSGCRAGFYGCNTASDPDGDGDKKAFIANLALQTNFNGVTLIGQPESSYPSFFTNCRYNIGRDDKEEANYWPVTEDNKTYLVAVSEKNVFKQKFYQTPSSPAKRMRRVQGGQYLSSSYQPGNQGEVRTNFGVPSKK